MNDIELNSCINELRKAIDEITIDSNVVNELSKILSLYYCSL